MTSLAALKSVFPLAPKDFGIVYSRNMVSGRKSPPEAKGGDEATWQQPVPSSAAQADVSMPGDAFRHAHAPS